MADNNNTDDGKKLSKNQRRKLRQKELESKPLQDDPVPVRLPADESDEHNFWDTQPVPKSAEDVGNVNQAIEPNSAIENLRQEPYNLPEGFSWTETDMSDEAQRKEVYELLAENYVEDDDNMFRFDYSMDFLDWAVKPPGYLTQWHIGVRRGDTLVAFITAIPAHVVVYGREVRMVEINFLCVHTSLRSRRLAPVLIKEITRRVNLQGIFQALYTAGSVLPKPICSARYYHRSLNPKKLIAIGFSRLPKLMTLARTIRLYSVPTETQTPGFRPMVKRDLDRCFKLVTSYLEKFKVYVRFSKKEFEHWLLPRKDVISSYVVENPETGEITDFASFYHLPSSILKHAEYKTLRVAYSFYNVARTVSWPDLMNDMLICAKQAGFDVMNCLNLMDNDKFIKDCKFGEGDGNLQYYIYNWKCPPMHSRQCGVVLL